MENKKTLEDALADMEASKKQAADYQKEFAAEIEAENAKTRVLIARMAALTQEERRKVLKAAGLNISAAPPPITPIRGAWGSAPWTEPRKAAPTKPTPQPAPASEPVMPIAVLLEQTDDAGLSKRERQIRAIEAAASAQGYGALSIPTGGKTILRAQCQKSNLLLFGAGPDPFDDAWRVAIACDPPRLRMADHGKFTGK